MLVVTRTPTPIAQTSFPGLIEAAFQAEREPLRGIQRMMLAVLAAIETARGRSVMNFNVGNITAGPTYTGAVWRPPWFELDPGALQRGELSPRIVALHEAMLAGRAPSAFRAYSSADEGARDFARVLLRNFPEVMNAALVPNAENFRAALARRYSRDYENPKATESLAQLMKEFGIVATAATAGAGGLVVAALILLVLLSFKKR